MIDNAAALDSRADNGPPVAAMIHRFKEYEAILARNSIGRIAFAVADRVSVLPVHYVYTGGWIYLQTNVTPRLRQLLRNRRIAFEVDEHNLLLEWRSVVVRGPLYPIDAALSASPVGIYARMLSLISDLLSRRRSRAGAAEGLSEQLFRLRIVEISGRASDYDRGPHAPVSTLQHSVG